MESNLGLALVLVSHDIGVVARLCQSTAVVHDGQIVEHGPTTRVLDDPRHPYTRRLLTAVPRLPVWMDP